jgi:hypothetical protein
MITKLAIFEGTLKPGKEAEMRAYVERVLRPLWEAFEGAHRVRVLHGTKSDDKGPPIPLILEVDYLTQAHLDQAMASPARVESRDLLPGFYEAFFETVDLRHVETKSFTT